jgi:hypothetical protein
MVNFRYHVVSIVAVFLALGLGVLVGTSVIDRFTLDFLEDEVARADSAVTATQRENARLRDDLDRERDLMDRWMEASGPRLLRDRLDEVPVLVLSVEGIDEDPVEELRTALADASARYQGTVWFTERLRLENEQDVEDLAAIVGVGSADPDTVRRALVEGLASQLLTPRSQLPGPDEDAPETLLTKLFGAGFAEFQQPGSNAPAEAALPVPGTRFVVVGGADADVPTADLLDPLTAAVAAEDVAPVVAAVAGPAAEADDEERALALGFVLALRDNGDVEDHLSTVDNLAQFPGQAATVLALEDLARGVVGHYGVADGAEELLPPDAP